MHVKICGITRLQDATGAIHLGADMLGFNFYSRSKRYVTPAACAEMIAGLTAAGQTAVFVGIFVNMPVPEVNQIMRECGLDLAQLSGDEPPQALRKLPNKAFKALRPPSSDAVAGQVQQYAPFTVKPAFLLDAYHPDEYGGTGNTGDWAAAARFARDYPLMLAGGLTPDNVATAVAQVQPWGVDVASGVETAPGVKDVVKMQAFIENAKGTVSK